MAEEDIYKNKAKYERFLAGLDALAVPPKKRPAGRRNAIYVVKNPENLKHFLRLHHVFESRDVSHIRRMRVVYTVLLASHAAEKDFADCTRDDVNKIVAFMHTRYKSPKSKRDFILDLRYVWKHLFPEKDREGREDETVVPYPVRHLSAKIDKSKERMRNDRLSWEEFKRIVDYFAHDPRIQAYVMLAMESLGRPQEILTRKLKHVELHDLYAKVWLTERGKEGPGLLQCIDSFPYLVKWLKEHPLKSDPEAHLFINIGNTHFGKGLTPFNMNKHLRRACRDLNIKKGVTCYSLKRNGVTFRRLRGDSDLEIQHAARWTSTKQLNTYDLSKQEDAMQVELIKRGIVKPKDGEKHLQPATRECIYCGTLSGFTEQFCSNCKRPLDRDAIKGQIKTVEGMEQRMKEQEEKLQKFERVTKLLEPLVRENPELFEALAKKAKPET